jgi:purine-nucleoside phosphorylase
MGTPHIEALKGDIAETVLMPGDPLRAKFIAETYLTDVKKINNVRNMFGYTGYYNGKRVSVMGSGMGMPSIGIYSYELFKYYGVNKIIRIGTCGSMNPNLKIFDVILVNFSYSDSTYAYIQNGCTDKLISSSLSLTNHIEEIANKNGISIVRGNIYSTDVFYKKKNDFKTIVDDYKCLGVEMESFALFHNAKVLGKESACILTVSDSLITKEVTSSEEREKSFATMIELSLKAL